MKRIFKVFSLCLAAMLLLSCLGAAGFAASDEDFTVDDACSGVVRVVANFGRSISCGSGFGVGVAGEETDIFVTNWHVITGDNGRQSDEVYILLDNRAVTLRDGYIDEFNTSHMVKCRVLYTTTGYPDVAILQAVTPVEGHVALPLRYSEDVHRSEEIYALGFPGDGDSFTINDRGEGFYYAEVSDVIATNGIVSRLTKLASANNNSVIQHTASINHGNSGGPLIDSNGAVVGINTYGVGESGYSTSIYIDYAIEALDELNLYYEIYGENVPAPATAASPSPDPSDDKNDDENDEEEDDESSVPAIAVIGGIAALVLIGAVIIVKKSGSSSKSGSSAGSPPVGAPNGAYAGRPAGAPVGAPNGAYAGRPAGAPVGAPNGAYAGRPNGVPVGAPVGGAAVQQPNDPPSLVGVSGVFSGKRIRVSGVLRMGRGGGNQLTFPQETAGVSGEHCEIGAKGAQLFLRDLGSSYGTFVNGKKLAPNQPVTLNAGDVIWLATQEQSFRVEKSAGGGYAPVNSAQQARGVVVRSGSLAGSRANMTQSGILIGRAEEANLRFPESIKSVSRHHAKLLVHNGKLCLADLGSTNGTYLANGSRIDPQQPVPVSVGDIFYVGNGENGIEIV